MREERSVAPAQLRNVCLGDLTASLARLQNCDEQIALRRDFEHQCRVW